MKKLVLLLALLTGCHKAAPPPPAPTPTPAPHPGATVLTPTTTIAAESFPNTAMSPNWQPAGAGNPGPTPTPTPGTTPSPTPTPSSLGASSRHVVWVMEENHPASSISSSNMPYMVGLGNTYAFTTNMTANAAGSLLDYIAITSGSLQSAFGCNGTNCGTPITADNIFQQLVTNGFSFKCYMESIPGVGSTAGDQIGDYVKRHNPCPWYAVVQNGLLNNMVGTDQLALDIANNALPTFSFVSPNLCDDAHGEATAACPGALQTADSWLQGHIQPLFNTAPFQAGGDGLLIITFDETSAASECCVYTVIAGPRVHRALIITTATTSYAILRLTMQVLNINDFPGASATAGDALLAVFQ